MSDADVIAAIRAQHLKANIAQFEADQDTIVHWERATVDPGGSLFGAGPYLKVPVTGLMCDGETLMLRVYAPERLRRKLAKAWRPA